MKNISKGTIIRTACLILTLVNAGLAIFGKSPLPVDDAMIEQVVSFVFVAASSLAAWWKNNSFSKDAIQADRFLKSLKEGE